MKFDLIILNYKNYEDTIELLRSLIFQKLELVNTIYLVDNASCNDSISHILSELDVDISEYDIELDSHCSFSTFYLDKKLNVIQSKINLGYAGGNNLAISESLKDCASQYCVICNNDLVFPSNQLDLFLKRAAQEFLEPKVGLLGSVLYFYDKPDSIQAVGGGYIKLTSQTYHFQKIEDSSVADYPVGALLAVKKSTLNSIGLFDESYFLYFEELDYVYRMKVNGLVFKIITDCKILHKEGASAGSDARDYRGVSIISDYYMNINKLNFCSKYHKCLLPVYYLIIVLNSFRRILRGERRKGLNLLRGLLGLSYV